MTLNNEEFRQPAFRSHRNPKTTDTPLRLPAGKISIDVHGKSIQPAKISIQSGHENGAENWHQHMKT